MKTRIVLAVFILAAWIGSARAQSTAICPPVNPNSGISSTIVPAIANANPAGCDWGLTIGPSVVILQGPVNRHFFKITNTSPSNGSSLGICFGRIELGGGTFVCTMTTAGTVLTPGQSFYEGVAMYGGLPVFNSMFFNDSIELIGGGSNVSVSVSID